ncbi:hypothetical protein MKX42_23745 [Paenibacillus sp. FSL R7-0204]|uniref:hypothetical protein n=1 Tax=Paenibacillus sp. FSL R7-0204 TaxID=2921675 RepID=UPI0030F71F01
MLTQDIQDQLSALIEPEKGELINLIHDIVSDVEIRKKLVPFYSKLKLLSSTQKDDFFNNIESFIHDKDIQSKLFQLQQVLAGLPILRRERLFRHFQLLSTDQELDNIFWELSAVRTDPKDNKLTREKVLDRIKRYTKASLKNYRKNTLSEFKPEVTQNMLIHVDFTGIGGEHDMPHYAIVWNVDPKRDNVLVIPTTSLKEDKKFYTHYFSVGKIDFLSEETVVMLDQTVSISHKRILSETFINPQGVRTAVTIDLHQEHRIKDGIRATYLDQKTLYWYLYNNFRKFIPEMENEEVQFNHLLRPFILVSNDPEKLVYSLIDQPHIHYQVFWRRSTVIATQRTQLLENWCYALGSHQRNPQTGVRGNVLTYRRDEVISAYSSMIAASDRS